MLCLQLRCNLFARALIADGVLEVCLGVVGERLGVVLEDSTGSVGWVAQVLLGCQLFHLN